MLATTQTPTSGPLPREIAVRFVPIIRQAAARLARRLPAHIDVDDLIGAGFIGLVDAYRRYDVDRSDRFDAYADYRIRGAMLDELRALDPLSRDLRALATRTASARWSLEKRLGRAPQEEEIASELGLDLEAFQGYSSRMAVGRTVSLDAPTQESETGMDIRDDRVVPADESLHDLESREALALATEALPPRLRQILELYYGKELTLRDIGGVLGVTESRVCQLHGEAIKRLRARCSKSVPPPTRGGSETRVKNDPSVGQARPHGGSVAAPRMTARRLRAGTVVAPRRSPSGSMPRATAVDASDEPMSVRSL